MKIICLSLLGIILFAGCEHKEKEDEEIVNCNMQEVYSNNAAKVTIANGIWGTISFMEGNCMPVYYPAGGSCKNCPVKRTVRIYEYTTVDKSEPQKLDRFYNSFSTKLIKQFETDVNGFYQTELTPGKYTIVVIEEGKLYAFGFDGTSGISPINYTSGKQNLNLTLTYKAVF